MLQYHEILRLIAQGYSQSWINMSTGHSRTSIIKVLQRVNELQVTCEDLLNKTDAELRNLLFPEEVLDTSKRMPDFDALRKELVRPGVTKMLLWQEYLKQCQQLGADAYGRSQFFKLFRLSDEKANVTMHIERKPGVTMEVDWSGDPFPIFNGSKDKPLKAQIFVAVLAYSKYTYVEAFPDQKLTSWIYAHIHAFEFFGGVTRELVPDNCKTAVLYNDLDGIKLNETYRELSEHYTTIVIPARVRKPRDKASAESGVANTQRSIMAPLRDQEFYSLAELNLALRNQLEIFNGKPFQKKEGSRREIYEKEEKEFLTPLPSVRYEMAEWKVAKVQSCSHVAADKKMYSVPFMYIGKKVDVKISRQLVEIFYKHARIAAHNRSFDPKERYVTIGTHLPKDKQTAGKWNGTSLREWASRIGVSTLGVIDTLLSKAKYEQQAYRSCLAVLNLTKTVSESLLELACKESIAGGGVSLRQIKAKIKLLSACSAQKEQEIKTETVVNPHGITRGAKYFERRES